MRDYLVKLRNESGLSMRKLSIKADISHQLYSQIEMGKIGKKVSLMTMGKIAEALGVSISLIYALEKDYIESI